MLAAALVLALIGILMGYVLALAAKIFHVDGDPLAEEINEMLPGTQCGQCGFAGCTAAAQAIAEGDASVTCCPPGGKALAEKLAAKLSISINLDELEDEKRFATINAKQCIGCTRCLKVCPTDAIIGANKQIHRVIRKACTGCRKCEEACPEDCIKLIPNQSDADNWYWPKPAA